MKFKKPISYTLIFLLQFFITTKANTNIDLNTNEVFKLIEVSEKSLASDETISAIYNLNHTSNSKWFVRTGCWKEVDILISQGDSILKQQIFSWNDESNALFCHELSAKRSLLFPINIPQGNIMLKINARDPIQTGFPSVFDISIGTEAYFLKQNENGAFAVMVLTIPILLSFGFINLILFFFMRDRSYLMYFFVQVSFVIICLVTYGYLPFPIDYIFGLLAPARLLYTVVYLLFTMSFFNLHKTEPLLNKVFSVYVIFTAVLFLASSVLLVNMELFLFKWLEIFTVSFSPGITIVLLLYLIIKRIIKKDKLAYSFGAATVTFLFFAMASYLLQINVVPDSMWNHKGLSIVMVVESVAFTAVLVYRFKYLKNQLDESLLEVNSFISDNEILKKELHDILNENFNLEQDWTQVQVKFELLHKGFTARLNLKHPTLSLTDIKMSILMKLSLNNKEIASFLNIQPRSVVQASYRMKKKMDLSSEIIIADYIRTL